VQRPQGALRFFAPEADAVGFFQTEDIDGDHSG
jgi:hypothetical protein